LSKSPEAGNLDRMTDSITARQDRLVSQGVKQFMKTLERSVATKSIVITIQADGYLQVHASMDEPELTKQLMRVASGDRKGVKPN